MAKGGEYDGLALEGARPSLRLESYIRLAGSGMPIEEGDDS